MTGNDAASTWIFSHDNSVEPELHGNPRTVHLKHREPVGGLISETVSEHLPNGSLSQRVSFRRDGTVSYREVYEYASEKHYSIRLYDGIGHLLRSTEFRPAPDGEERLIRDGESSAIVERTLTKYDALGRAIESTLTDLLTGQITSFRVSYTPTEHADAELTFSGNGDVAKIVFHKGPDGMTSEYLSGDGRVVASHYCADAREVQEFDARQNWVSKQVYETDAAGTEYLARSLTREIKYY